MPKGPALISDASKQGPFIAEFGLQADTWGAAKCDEVQTKKIDNALYDKIINISNIESQYEAIDAAKYTFLKDVPLGFYTNRDLVTRIDFLLNVPYAPSCRRWFLEEIQHLVTGPGASATQEALMKLIAKLKQIGLDSAKDPDAVTNPAGTMEKVKAECQNAIKEAALGQAALISNQAASGMMTGLMSAALSAVSPISPTTVVQFVKHMSYQSVHDALLLRQEQKITKSMMFLDCSESLQQFLVQEGVVADPTKSKSRGFPCCCFGSKNPNPSVEIRPYLQEYFDESNRKARKLANAVLSILAVFVCPSFRMVYDMKLYLQDQKKQMIEVIKNMESQIKEVRDSLPEAVQPTFDQFMDDSKSQAMDKAEEIRQLAQEEAKNQASKAADDMKNKLMEKLGEILQMDKSDIEAKANEAKNKVKEASQSNGAQTAGKSTMAAKDLVKNWLSVLAYPVFAPNHGSASEYLWRKIILAKKIKRKMQEADAKAKEQAEKAKEKAAEQGLLEMANGFMEKMDDAKNAVVDKAQEAKDNIDNNEQAQGFLAQAKNAANNAMDAATAKMQEQMNAYLGEVMKKFSAHEDDQENQVKQKLTESCDLEVRGLCKLLDWSPEDIEKWIARSYRPIQASDIGISGADIQRHSEAALAPGGYFDQMKGAAGKVGAMAGKAAGAIDIGGVKLASG